MKPSILPALLVLLPSAHGWGGLGHQTVAFVASNFVTPKTALYFQQLFNDPSSEYLAKVATWADSFRYTANGRFTAPFHYIDSKDDPPLKCGVALDRDCGLAGCVVGAISNYVRFSFYLICNFKPKNDTKLTSFIDDKTNGSNSSLLGTRDGCQIRGSREPHLPT